MCSPTYPDFPLRMLIKIISKTVKKQPWRIYLNTSGIGLFFKNIFIDYVITVVPFFSPPNSPPCYTPPPTSFPPTPATQFMSMGRTYKFLGFSISCTILNLPMSILYLPFMLLIPCTFSHIAHHPFPADNPPCDLHFCDQVPVLVLCLVCFWFCFFF